MLIKDMTLMLLYDGNNDKEKTKEFLAKIKNNIQEQKLEDALWFPELYFVACLTRYVLFCT